MSKYESIKKELYYLYEAKKILEKYCINTRSIEARIITCLKQLKILEELCIC